jgi:acetyl esterase/lipase
MRGGLYVLSSLLFPLLFPLPSTRLPFPFPPLSSPQHTPPNNQVGGQRAYQPWLSHWLLDLALQTPAILVSADYRLIPEATARDAIDDARDAVGWIWGRGAGGAEGGGAGEEGGEEGGGLEGGGLEGALEEVYPGLGLRVRRRVLVGGDSAGGYLAVQLGLSNHSLTRSHSDLKTNLNTKGQRQRRDPVKIDAVYALYPYLSLRTPFHTEAYPKDIAGVEQMPESLLDEHLDGIRVYVREGAGAGVGVGEGGRRKRPVVTNVPMVQLESESADSGGHGEVGAVGLGGEAAAKAGFTARALLAICMEQHGRTLEFFSFDPEREQGRGTSTEAQTKTTPSLFPEDRIEAGEKLPPFVLVHGVQDRIAPVEGSDMFVEHLRKWNGVAGMGSGADASASASAGEIAREEREREVFRYFREEGDHFFEAETRLDAESAGWVGEAGQFLRRHWLGLDSGGDLEEGEA